MSAPARAPAIPPTVVLITPVEDMTVKDRPLPGVIVSHHVTSFDA